jgi:hypothetical protein
MHFQLDCGKLILMGHQSCMWAWLALFLIAPFRTLILLSLLRDKSLLVPIYPNTWIFGRLALHKVQLMK